ncbi:MAG: hypothetical protein WBH28_13835, partial [Fuerstiella sp.]
PSAFEKKIIPVDTLVEQELLSNSAVKSKFSVYPAPSIFRPYFDTSETTRWCKKHYPDYVQRGRSQDALVKVLVLDMQMPLFCF